MNIKKKMVCGIAVLLLLFLTANVRGDQEETKFQWVIVSSASALAQDGSTITMTGSGTFELGDPEEVTGGGTWTTATGSGTYQVTRLIKFTLAPGASPTNPAIRAGLAFLSVAYSDGSRGVLVVSCHALGTPDSVAEGIIASKGFVLYWNHIQAPAFFRVLPEDED